MAIREEVWHLKIAVDPSKSSGFIANFAMAKSPHFSVTLRGLGLGLSGRVLRSGRSGEAAGNSRGGPWLRRIWGYCGKALVTNPANRMMIPIDDVA